MEKRLKIKEQNQTTMVRGRLGLSDAMYDSIKHIDGVGKRSDYSEEKLVALITQINIKHPVNDPPRKDEPKVNKSPRHSNQQTSKLPPQTRPQARNKSTASSYTATHSGQGSNTTHSKGSG